ncbi:hypothetical protein CsatB_028774 [Cannabis sativa]
MQAKLQRHEEKLQCLKQQAPPIVPPQQVPLVFIPVLPVGHLALVTKWNHCTKGSKARTLSFLGGPDVMKARQCLATMNRILKFMGVTGNDQSIIKI